MITLAAQAILVGSGFVLLVAVVMGWGMGGRQ